MPKSCFLALFLVLSAVVCAHADTAPQVAVMQVPTTDPRLVKLELRFFWVHAAPPIFDPLGTACTDDPSQGHWAGWQASRVDVSGVMHEHPMRVSPGGCSATLRLTKGGIYWVRVQTPLGLVETRVRIGRLPHARP